MRVPKSSDKEKPRALPPVWRQVNVTWDFVTSLCASVPSRSDLLEIWLRSRAPKVRAPQGKTIAEIAEEVAGTLAEPEPEFTELIFQRVDGTLVVRAATIRAHIKDCASILSSLYVGRIENERSFAVRMKNSIYYPPEVYWLPIQRQDASVVKSPDGKLDRFVHTFSGASFKRFEIIKGARMQFPLLLLGNAVLVSDLETIFQYGGVHGYGGERSNGEGRYTYTIKEVDE